jgi:hypothetical protein
MNFQFPIKWRIPQLGADFVFSHEKLCALLFIININIIIIIIIIMFRH